MHNSFILQQYVCYTTILSMFRAARCSSSGGQIVSPQPLVLSPSVSSRTVCRWRADCSPLSTRDELSYLAPQGSENISAPYFKQCFFRGRGGITPQTESNTTPPSPKTEITNILFYVLNLWLRIYCSGLRGSDTHEKEIVI